MAGEVQKKGVDMSQEGKKLAKARDKWLNSDEGKKCCEGSTSGQYLQNRLKFAFIAGWYAKKVEQPAEPEVAAENKRLKPFEIAVKKRHNGYDPEVCKELGINPPESPEQALQELQDEWNRMENNYVEQIVKLQKKIKQLENPDGK